ncbi:hypothetical protein L0U85_05045 [Glycomyces sp. L485]|uniref:hypothetical protein n=1 Tax=Glycomyces sp. L485 TaxID=2909235 RepID=UPI001F4B1665|nr:hypothetical protein [Glycomyces sp. L485]MCH7230229.1 hypothetical protein [Glycomyces sp. L485]
MALTLAFLTGCTVGDETNTTDSSAPIESSGTVEETETAGPVEPAADVYVTRITTLEGDGELYSDQMPDALMLQEFTFTSDLEWQTWGPDTAVASGRVSGFCWPDCEDGYEATIVLCDVVDAHFTRFAVFGDFPRDDVEPWILGSPIAFGGGTFDEGNVYGCEEPDLTSLS